MDKPSLHAERAQARSVVGGFDRCELALLSWAHDATTTVQYNCRKAPESARAEFDALASTLRNCLDGWSGPPVRGAMDDYGLVVLGKDAMSVHLNSYHDALALTFIKTFQNH